MSEFREKKGLEKARQIQQDWLEYGLDFVDRYIDDTEGDALDNWGEETAASQSSQVKTCQWLQGIFEQGWRSLESLLEEYQLSFVSTLILNEDQSFAPTMTRGSKNEEEQVKAVKPLHFDVEPIPKVFALLVVRLPLEDGRVRIEIKLHPMGKKGILPRGVELRALDENDTLIQDPVVSGEEDTLIQLQALTTPTGTPLQVQIRYQEIVKTENFVLS